MIFVIQGVISEMTKVTCFVTNHRSINKLCEHSINSGTGLAMHYAFSFCFLLSKAITVKKIKGFTKGFTSIINVGNSQKQNSTYLVRAV